MASTARKKTTAKAVDSPFKNFTPYKPKKNEPYMSEGQLEHFRDILQKWRQELMEEVDRTLGHMQDEAANFPDPADRASQEEEFSLELRARDRERKLNKKIDETLQLIEDNEYAWCDSCGVEIGIRRRHDVGQRGARDQRTIDADVFAQIDVLHPKPVVVVAIVGVVREAVVLFLRIVQHQTQLHPLTRQFAV